MRKTGLTRGVVRCQQPRQRPWTEESRFCRPANAGGTTMNPAARQRAATGRPDAASLQREGPRARSEPRPARRARRRPPRPPEAGRWCETGGQTEPHSAHKDQWPPSGRWRVAKRDERRLPQRVGGPPAHDAVPAGGCRSTRGGEAEGAAAAEGGGAQREPAVDEEG